MRLHLDTRTKHRAKPRTSLVSKQAWEKLAAGASPPKAKHEPSSWVRLVNPPTAFSFDEAWLLCQCSESQWLAWIPDYGELLLSAGEFY